MKIYAIKISDISDEKLHNLCLFLDAEKKVRIKNFVNKKDKIRTLIGEILIRTMIIEELNIRNESIIFDKNKYGKPYLKHYPTFNFNISHSGDFVVCAIDDKPIGIDIEQVKDIEYKDISESFFTENEFKYISQKDSYSQLTKFYKIWTLKESYIKCCGQGLSMPLKSFSIDIERDDNIKVFTNNSYDKHIFKMFDIDSNYKISVCSLNKKISRNIIMIEQNDLIGGVLYERY